MDNLEVNSFILNEIVPKYDDVRRFHSHISDKLDLGVEFIFHVRFNMFKDELDVLKKNIESDLLKYYNTHGIEPHFIIILNTF